MAEIELLKNEYMLIQKFTKIQTTPAVIENWKKKQMFKNASKLRSLYETNSSLSDTVLLGLVRVYENTNNVASLTVHHCKLLLLLHFWHAFMNIKS